jgi:hypothetical protein
MVVTIPGVAREIDLKDPVESMGRFQCANTNSEFRLDRPMSASTQLW